MSKSRGQPIAPEDAKRVEERLRRSEARYRWLTEHLTDVVWASDLSLRMSYVSPSVIQQRGFSPEEVLAQSPEEMLTEESLACARAALEAKLRGAPDEYTSAITFEVESRCRDGSTLPVEVKAALTVDENGTPTGILGVTRDISERRRAEAERDAMEEQLRQSQKMEAIGTLAGGIAHDFNNLLTAILGSASVMRLRLPASSDLREDLGRIEKAAQRAAELTRQLLGFARKGKLHHEPVDMHQIVDEVISILKHTIDKRIRITVEKIAAPALVMGDPGQLAQVVLNLAVNASEAMPEGGMLTFSARTVDLDDDESAASIGAGPGRYVVTEVTDTGRGVPADLRGRVFEPFFTTKPVGKGTGMGLAVAYGIAENHGGVLTLDDERAGGATFSVYLPAAEQPTRSDAVLEGEPARGSGRILVVDDERVVCQTVATMLGALGYQVECVRNGSDALARCAAADIRPDLVILDLAMPGMDGRECLRELRARAPEVRVLVSTGQALAGEAAELVRQGAAGFLPKPYVARELARAVLEALSD